MFKQRSAAVKFVIASLLAIMAVGVQAQCRSFAKNKCVPGLAPYKFNESFNAAQLSPGEEAEVSLTFFSGQEYRIMVCTHPILGEVNWKLVDQTDKVVFESLATDPKQSFDLKAAGTTQMKVMVTVPDRDGGTMVHVGCVAILVGFKE